MEEAAGSARPAPAAHQHSGRAAARGERKAALGGIPGIWLGGGKNSLCCFF